MTSAIQAHAATTDNNIFSGDIGIFNEAVTGSQVINRNMFKFDISDALKCSSQASNTFKQHYKKVGELVMDGELEQEARAEVLKCVQETGIAQEMAAAMKTDIDASAKKTGTLVGLGDVMARLLPVILPILIVFVIVLIIYAIVKKKKDKGAGTGTGGKPGAGTGGKPGAGTGGRPSTGTGASTGGSSGSTTRFPN